MRQLIVRITLQRLKFHNWDIMKNKKKSKIKNLNNNFIGINTLQWDVFVIQWLINLINKETSCIYKNISIKHVWFFHNHWEGHTMAW